MAYIQKASTRQRGHEGNASRFRERESRSQVLVLVAHHFRTLGGNIAYLRLVRDRPLLRRGLPFVLMFFILLESVGFGTIRTGHGHARFTGISRARCTSGEAFRMADDSSNYRKSFHEPQGGDFGNSFLFKNGR